MNKQAKTPKTSRGVYIKFTLIMIASALTGALISIFLLGREDGLMQLKYDDPNLPGAPDAVRQEYRKRRNRPKLCFCTIPDRNMVMLVRYGRSGYWPIEHFPEGMKAEEYADKLNQTLGVSKAQQTAMLYGSMFGWNVSAAIPDWYDERGKPKSREKLFSELER